MHILNSLQDIAIVFLCGVNSAAWLEKNQKVFSQKLAAGVAARSDGMHLCSSMLLQFQKFSSCISNVFQYIPNVTGIAAIAGWVESHSFHFQCNLNEKEMWPWWEGGCKGLIGQILNKDFICSLSQIFGFHFWKVSHNLLFILQINNSWFVLISRRTFYCIENTNTNSNTFQRNPPDNICKKLAEKNSNLVPH